MSTTAVASHPRLALLARTSFIATLVAAFISLILLLVQVYIYLLNHPPVQLTDLVSALLKTVAAGGTGLGVLATVAGFVLRRINKRLAQAEQRRERVASVAGGIADKLQGAPEQIHRLSTGQGCAFPITMTVLGISIVVATITFAPSQQVALAVNNPLTTPAVTSQATATPTPTATPVPSTPTPAPHGAITEYAIPTPASNPDEIILGPDGNVWFTEAGGKKIGRITPAGAIAEFPAPGFTTQLEGIAVGSDGALWFTTFRDGKIGRMTPSGAVTEFTVGAFGLILPGIAAGPDGNLWYCAFPQGGPGKIGRITPSGTVTEFTSPAMTAPVSIARGPDGNLWFSDADAVGRITTAGAISEFPLPTAGVSPLNITAGPDGAIWFTAADDTAGTSLSIGKSTTSGSITLFPVGTRDSNTLAGITSGPDGALWFTEDTRIGRITTAGAITEFPLPAGVTNPEGIIAGPNGALWFTDASTNSIGLLTP